MKRRVVLVFLVVAAARAFAAEYPTKPVRIIAPFWLAGASISSHGCWRPTSASRLDSRSSSTTGRGVGQHRHRVAKNAAPDGDILLVNTLPFVTNQFVDHKMLYDPINDFAPITLLCSVVAVLMSHPSVR